MAKKSTKTTDASVTRGPAVPEAPTLNAALANSPVINNPSQRRATPTLNDLTSEMIEILRQIDIDAELGVGGGEISPFLEERLQAIEAELPAKIDGYVYVIRELLGYGEECSIEADRLSARAKAWKNKAAWLKGRILNTMQAIGETKIKTARNTVSVCKNGGALSIILPEDQSQIPDDYLTSRTVIEPDREKIKNVMLALEKYKPKEVGTQQQSDGQEITHFVQLEPELLMQSLTTDFGPDIAEVAFKILQAEGSDHKLSFASFAERGVHLKIS